MVMVLDVNQLQGANHAENRSDEYKDPFYLAVLLHNQSNLHANCKTDKADHVGS